MKKSRTLFYIGAGSLSFLALGMLSGCGTTQAVVSSPAQVAVVALEPMTAPDWWFPLQSDTAYLPVNSQMNHLMYIPLVSVNSSGAIDYADSLAKSIHWNATGERYTIRLNPQWRWSNGKPVTAQDVVWSADLLLQASSGNPRFSWMFGGAGIGGLPTTGSSGRWKSVVAKGSRTVVVTLNKPSNPTWFIRNGLSQIQPVPEAQWKKSSNWAKEMAFILSVSDTPQAAVYHVVDGPYQFDAKDSKTHDQYWTFTPNPDYAGHRSTLSRVVFTYESSDAAEFSALKTGKVTVGYLPYSMYADRSALKQDTLHAFFSLGFNNLYPNFNLKAPQNFGTLISHLYVRKALEMGIDQPVIVQKIFHGYGDV
ncbi:MAG: ABC transporter substrate-binding protein, partial [Firmicutes bacterium]|nr:ABC transporter substrate-binding protein [Bacillota bacterium]